MRIAAVFEKLDKEVGHLIRQVPTADRAAVNNREAISQPKLGTPSPAILGAKFKQLEICAAWNHFMNYSPTAQSLPILLCERHQAFRSCQGPPLYTLRKSIRIAAFVPMSSLDILLGHQSAHIKDHLEGISFF